VSDPPTNEPKVLVELTPEELTWLADRLHEMRNQWTGAEFLGATVDAANMSGTSYDKLMKAREQIEQHKKMEARLRNRFLDKAYDQGFGHL
jgi:hypothetical protein